MTPSTERPNLTRPFAAVWFGSSLAAARRDLAPQFFLVTSTLGLTMTTKSHRQKGRDGTLSSLNVAIETMNLAKEVSSVTPAKAVFGSVSILLTMIRVRSLRFHVRVSRVHL